MNILGLSALPEVVLDSEQTVGVGDVVAVPYSRDADGDLVVGPGLPESLDSGRLDPLTLLEHRSATGKPGEAFELLGSLPDGGVGTLLLVAVGDSTSGDLRRAGATLARRAKGRTEVISHLGGDATPEAVAALVEGLVLGSFRYDLKTREQPDHPRFRLVLAEESHADAVRRGVATAGANWFARSLAFVPSSTKNPPWLADVCADVAQHAGLEVEVWDDAALRAQGFGGLLAVGSASSTPPRLVQLSYTPDGAARRTAHVVLVGKGITFDSGGLSIKPADAMTTMKRDMTGAAVVLAVMRSLAEVGCPVRVTGLLALAENAVGADAMRPGDVVTHFGGRTTEVTNTDAEGRLVLADALAYAVDTLDPTVVVDIATLTGAMKVALGLRLGGFFATDEVLADRLVEAGSQSGEPLWRLPLVDEYADRIDSSIADADNAGGGPGAITAALFLRPFIGDVAWAHLDIASIGDSPVDAHEYSVGPTGFGARLLLSWLSGADPTAGFATRKKGRR